MTITAEQALSWLEDMHTLHCSVHVLYVVDGYQLTLVVDCEPTKKTVHGDTLVGAIEAAISAGWESSRYGEGVPKVEGNLKAQVERYRLVAERKMCEVLEEFHERTGLVPTEFSFSPIDTSTVDGPGEIVIGNYHLSAQT
jgi:hypothetical protein